MSERQALAQADRWKDEADKLRGDVRDLGEEVDRVVAENERLRAALAEARPYVYNVTADHRNDGWRVETACDILATVDEALARGGDDD